MDEKHDFEASDGTLPQGAGKSSLGASLEAVAGVLFETEHHLFYGNSRKPIFRVVPDAIYPQDVAGDAPGRLAFRHGEPDAGQGCGICDGRPWSAPARPNSASLANH